MQTDIKTTEECQTHDGKFVLIYNIFRKHLLRSDYIKHLVLQVSHKDLGTLKHYIIVHEVFYKAKTIFRNS